MSVTILSGANELKSAAYENRSIEDVRRELRTPLNIAEGAETHLNGQRISDPATVLRPGDELEFLKPGGEKGA